MALFYPDNLEHNNPNNPLMDVNQLRGSYNINLLSERDLIPLNKRSLTQNVSCRETERIYIYIGTTVDDIDWTNSSNWKSSAADAGGNYLPISGGTLTGLLSGTTISATDYSGITSTMVTNLSNLTGDTVTDVLNYLPIYTKSDTPPLNPRVDDVWLDTNTDRIPIEYIWFTDDNGDSFWVNWDVSNTIIGGSNYTGSTGNTGSTVVDSNVYFVNSYAQFKSIVENPLTSSESIVIYLSNTDTFFINSSFNIHTRNIFVYSVSTAFYCTDDFTITNTHETEICRLYIDGIVKWADVPNIITLINNTELYVKTLSCDIKPNTCSVDGGGLYYNTSEIATLTNCTQRNIWIPSINFNTLVNTGHTHTISEINNLQSSLDSKLPLSGGTLTGSLSGTSISATTFYGDGSNLTGVVSTHNALSGLQGGQSSQYYHLNQSEYSQVSGNSLDNRYVNGSGDTMTGTLIVPIISATTYSGITVSMIPTLQESLDTKSTKITYDNTPWVSTATTFTLSPIKRYDFGTGVTCTTSVVWTLSPMTDVTEDCEYWFKLVIGSGGTSHTFNGCTFGINNDPVVAGATYEFHIKKTIVFIRRTA